MKLTSDKITEDIIKLGIKRSDVFFISADLLKVGYFNKTIDQTYKDWVEILYNLIQLDGTFVIPAYTPTFSRFRKNKNIVFNQDSEPNAGALSKAIFKFGNAKRSSHPTNSCFAIGRHADYILNGHDKNASSYLPYERIVELGGKNLMIGSVDENNGPMAFHYVQEKLGHTYKHPTRFLRQTYYEDPLTFQKKIFTRKDVGGCTRGTHNLYGNHLISGAMKVDFVGKGLSACIDTKLSAEIIKKTLQNNPQLIRCEDKYCVSCYGRYVYNGLGILKFWPRKFLQILS